MIDIHPLATISPLADIEDSVRGTRIVIGANSVVDSFVKIKPAGGAGDIVVGTHCYINSGCVFYTGNGISMGNHILVAANCTFAPTNHAFDEKSRLIQHQGFQPSRGGIIVEDDVWIGANSVILDGAVLHKGCVIAAGSVVRSEVDSYAVVGDAPLRTFGNRT